MDDRSMAARVLALLDLTNLDDDCVEADVEALCARASGPAGRVAAVCVWPRFVASCRERLADDGIAVAAVANFPHGSDDIEGAVAETKGIVAAGGAEVDVVLPYTAWLAGKRGLAGDLVAACKDACAGSAHLKVILETGRLGSPENIGAASRDAIAAGADFLKTSTGKVEVSATPEAAEAMLSAIRDAPRPVGFKASGGIRTLADAQTYLAIADRIMGEGWAAPATFRFGASSLLDDLVAHLGNGGGA